MIRGDPKAEPVGLNPEAEAKTTAAEGAASSDLTVLLLELGGLAAEDLSLPQAGRRITRILAGGLQDLAACSILLFDPGQGLLEILAGYSSVEARGGSRPDVNRQLRFAPGEGVAGSVYHSGHPIFWDPECPQADILKRDEVLGTPRSLACLPLTAGGVHLGVLNLSFLRDDPFDDRRRRALIGLGRVVAGQLQAFARLQRLRERGGEGPAPRPASPGAGTQTDGSPSLPDFGYRELYEQSPLGLFSVDAVNGRVTRGNQAAASLLAVNGPLAGQELIGALGAAVSNPTLGRNIMAALSRGQSFHDMRLRIQRPARRDRWLSLSMEPIFDAEGAVFEGRFTAHDISDSQRATQALWQEKELFRLLVQEAPLGISLIRPDGAMEYLNPKFSEMFGYTLEDAPDGRSWFRRAFPDSVYREMVVASWVNDLKTAQVGESRPRIYEVTCKDSSVKTIHFRSVALSDGKQLVIYEDITAREKAARDLQRSEQRYRQLFDNVYDFICMHDLEGRFLAVNRAAAKTLGREPEQVVGHLVSDFAPARTRALFGEDYLKPIREKGSHEGVAIFLDDQGKERLLEYRNLLVDNPPEPPYVIGVGRDVTERIHSRKRLKQLQDQLAQAQRMESLGTLASGISHDFNNLLQAMGGHLELLTRLPETSELQEKHLSHLKGAVDRASTLVRQVLTFSRRVQPNQQLLDLNQVIGEAMHILKHTIPRMVSIRVEPSPQRAVVYADPHQMEQVILNLGTNARDAMPDGGELTIRVEREDLENRGAQVRPGVPPGQYVVLTMADTGCGMDQQTRQRIFEPFFTTKGVGKGTGLGLSSVYGIVKAHKGYMTCDSRPGQGATFRIHLPRYEGQSPALAGEPPPTVEALSGRETILLVEDEEVVLEASRELLEGFGYRVLGAASGEEALEVYAAHVDSVDLVILDLGMPGMGGLACLRRLAADYPGVRVLVASGYTFADQAEQAKRLGAAGFLAKPYSLEALLGNVRRLLD